MMCYWHCPTCLLHYRWSLHYPSVAIVMILVIWVVFALQVILAIWMSWLICAILTFTGVFPKDSSELGFDAKTNVRIDVLKQAAWFRMPYPGLYFTKLQHCVNSYFVG